MNVVQQDLDLYIQGHKFWNLKISWNFEYLKNDESWQKNAQLQSCQYLPSIVTIAKVVLHDLELNFQGQTFLVALLTNKWWKKENIKYCHQRESHIQAYFADQSCVTTVLFNINSVQLLCGEARQWNWINHYQRLHRHVTVAMTLSHFVLHLRFGQRHSVVAYRNRAVSMRRTTDDVEDAAPTEGYMTVTRTFRLLM